MLLRNRVFGVLSILVGLIMLSWWGFAITTDQIPELYTEPVDVYLHLSAEFLTALLLVLGGIGVIYQTAWGRTVHVFSLGMVLYAVIQAAGYYAQRGEFIFVGIFALIAVFALTGLQNSLQLVKLNKKPSR
jgi:hypothetical protein